MGRNDRVGEDGDAGADTAEHCEHAHGLATAAGRSLLDDQRGGDSSHQDLEAHSDQSKQCEGFQRRSERAGEIGDRESGYPDRDQPSAAEAVGKRGERQGPDAAQGEHRAEVRERGNAGVKVPRDRGQREDEH